MSDTIAAIATPGQPSAIGILRLSGPDTCAALDAVFRAKNGRPAAQQRPRAMVLGELLDETGQVIDSVLCVHFPAPHSYTGEDCAELHCHGSPIVLDTGLRALFAAGCRQAGPGEFTKRAFLNGQLDLLQAESVADLIDAETAQQAHNAVCQLDGALSRTVARIYDGLMDMAARFYAVVDYPDEDIEDLQREQMLDTLRRAQNDLEALVAGFSRGRLLKLGVPTVLLGKPNAGKSSLVNKILGEERVIVSNVAGTTRDAIDSRFTNSKGSFVFIDTAGMRKKSKIEEDIEKYSVLRATMAIDRADVCLIMIDATEGVTEQDTKVAGMAHEAGKASIIVVNKWDLVEKDDKTMARMTEEIRRDLAYMTYAPILFISAKTGQRVDKLFDMIDYVANQAAFRVTTGMLNTVLADAQTRVQPPTDKGRRLKIYYMTQVGVKPPHFVVFCNDRRLFHFSYQRYLENCIRSTFRLEGTPIILSIREKGDKED